MERAGLPDGGVLSRIEEAAKPPEGWGRPTFETRWSVLRMRADGGFELWAARLR